MERVGRECLVTHWPCSLSSQASITRSNTFTSFKSYSNKNIRIKKSDQKVRGENEVQNVCVNQFSNVDKPELVKLRSLSTNYH